MKKIGFLSFGHWSPSPHSGTQTAGDALLQSIDLAVAAEELGADGAYFRVHHFARQLGSPFPLLAAIGARTKKIEIGTAVIDMRYENPLYMAEDSGAADLIAGGRLQLGISRGSPEQVIDGWRYFGYVPPEGVSDADTQGAKMFIPNRRDLLSTYFRRENLRLGHLVPCVAPWIQAPKQSDNFLRPSRHYLICTPWILASQFLCR